MSTINLQTTQNYLSAERASTSQTLEVTDVRSRQQVVNEAPSTVADKISISSEAQTLLDAEMSAMAMDTGIEPPKAEPPKDSGGK